MTTYNNNRYGTTGLYYDSVELSRVFQIMDIQTSLLPTLKNDVRTLAQRPGSYFERQRIETRNIQLKLRLDCGTRDPQEIIKAWREEKRYLYKDEPKQMRLRETKYCNAILVGETPIKYEGTYGVVTFNFVCYDPFVYGDIHQQALSEGEQEITFEGELNTFPILLLTASGTTLKVTNQDTGEFVSVPGLASGRSVYIDMGSQLTVVGNAYKPVDLLSDYFAVEGTQSLKVEGGSGDIYYIERYL